MISRSFFYSIIHNHNYTNTELPIDLTYAEDGLDTYFIILVVEHVEQDIPCTTTEVLIQEGERLNYDYGLLSDLLLYNI